jgi:hypothetical protein
VEAERCLLLHVLYEDETWSPVYGENKFLTKW